MHPKMKMIFAGVDTHRRTHTAVLINCFGEKVFERKFQNSPTAIEEFYKDAKKHIKRSQQLVFGLEDCGGSGRPLAVFLKSKNLQVKKVNSNLSSEKRNSLLNSGKTDSIDAECVAQVLLTMLERLPDFEQEDIYWTLGTLVRKRASIVTDNVIVKNQFHSYIIMHYPSYKRFFNDVDCPTALEFWHRFPSPSHLNDVAEEALGLILHERSSGFFDVVKAREILELVKKDGDTASKFQTSRDFIIKNCIDEVRHNNSEISKIEKEIKALMKTLPYKLETMKGVDFVTAAAITAEVGDIKRFANADKLAKYAGCSPVSRSSGDTEKNVRNKYGNRRLYYIFQGIAARNISAGRNKNKPVNGLFYEYYHRKISQGKTSAQAIKAVTRRVINIVYGLMKSGKSYVHPQQENIKG
jgi:transposase